MKISEKIIEKIKWYKMGRKSLKPSQEYLIQIFDRIKSMEYSLLLAIPFIVKTNWKEWIENPNLEDTEVLFETTITIDIVNLKGNPPRDQYSLIISQFSMDKIFIQITKFKMNTNDNAIAECKLNIKANWNLNILDEFEYN